MVWAEDHLTVLAGRLDGNRYLTAVKNSFIGAMSLLIIGSFFILLAYLPIGGYTDFMAGTFGSDWQSFFTIPYNVTMGAMTLWVVIGIANSLSESYKLDRMACILAALVSFLVLTPTEVLVGSGGTGLPLANLSANGLFLGMIVAVAAVEILRFVDHRGWTIKMPASVPSNVAKSFSSLIPIAVLLVLFNVVRMLFTVTEYHDAQTFIFALLQSPLTALGATLPATLLASFVESALWIFGIHGGNIVGGIMTPIWLSLTSENATALAAGHTLPNIVDYQFYMNFVKVGGSGATFGLVLLLVFLAKSKQFRTIGKLAIGPEIFTINEPIIFGIPVVLNPILIIPFVLTPLVLCVVAWVSMATGIVPLTNGVNIPWTTPPIISGFLVSGWQGATLNVVQIVISALIYFPFFKVADRIALGKELAAEAEITAEASLGKPTQVAAA
ncbi:PTS sugar transporter subunit IIC [Cryobacterium sp. 10S3]|nr:PTS sugar transporter subunit IIC [Cryobacterium sp. 10S3]WPX13280.1 PTS sugar transporter subunit IIC [Cryobacterium sp. 10S3]